MDLKSTKIKNADKTSPKVQLFGKQSSKTRTSFELLTDSDRHFSKSQVTAFIATSCHGLSNRLL